MPVPKPTERRNWARQASAVLAGVALGLLLLEAETRAARDIGLGSAVRLDNAPRDDRPIDALFRSAPPVQRILILGDSMAYAPGIGQSAVWSARFESLLNEAQQTAEVVNLGRGGDNTYRQLQVMREALDHQRIDLVLLLYNHNDVYGRRGPSEPPPEIPGATRAEGAESLERPADEAVAKSSDRRRAAVARAARWLRQRSQFSSVALARMGLQLRAWGILVPGTEFHHLARRGYQPDSPGWAAVQNELTAMQKLATRSSTSFAIYVLPQFASLRHDFFADVRVQLAAHAERTGTTIGFGFPAFEGGSWRTFAMSPFDGHPNERANQRIAEVIFEWVQDRGLLDAGRAAGN